MTPTQRTLKALRADGWTAQVVERWNAFAKVRQDLFGCIDIVAVHPHRSILAVQCTSMSNLADRQKKCSELPAVRLWLKGGGCFYCVGWRKLKKTGKYEMCCRVARLHWMGKDYRIDWS